MNREHGRAVSRGSRAGTRLNVFAGDQPQIPARAGEEPAPPRARTLFRQGAVYGLAGALKAADVAVAAARGAVRGAREGVQTDGAPDEPGRPPAADA